MKNNKNGLNTFIKYSSLAFEMGILIAGCAYLGHYIDSKINSAKPYFTIALSLFAVFASIYLVIKRLSNDNK